MTGKGCCIRENGLADRYIQRDGTFGAYKTRAKFHSHNAADSFAAKHGIEVYGIFP